MMMLTGWLPARVVHRPSIVEEQELAVADAGRAPLHIGSSSPGSFGTNDLLVEVQSLP